ncbi:hypothetical protein [Natrinema gelatinilyticum]|uniref:hypothetical protein n=1 Tax=Natrinema gelatinilyticum TaxID=2961571 RepID=UPI0020C34D1E|nr:hypothetical protein [Natrinema gelatinilyticum]
MPDGEGQRTIAKCISCGSAYAAEKWPDGTIQPIGTRDGCQCGATEFQVVERSEDTVLDGVNE